MTRTLALTSLLPLLLLATPASAATKEQKMETCKFGADDAKLEGAKRKTFMANCMANRDDKRGPGPKPAAEMAPGSDKKQ
ncbi:MAG: PsiF family protein [Pseudolabrys sp.]